MLNMLDMEFAIWSSPLFINYHYISFVLFFGSALAQESHLVGIGKRIGYQVLNPVQLYEDSALSAVFSLWPQGHAFL